MGLGKRKPAKRSGKNSGSGVGLSKQNVHWFLLGTKTRQVENFRGRKLNKRRKSGQIKAVPAVANAGRKALHDILATVRRTALAEIERTARK